MTSDNTVLGDIASFLSDPAQRKLAADCTLIGYNGSVSVHKFILAARSRVFREMIDSEPDRRSISLSRFPAKALEALVDFLYSDQLPPDEQLEDVEHELLQLAQQFELNQLKQLCEISIEGHVHI